MSLLGKLFGVAKGFATGGPGGAVSALLPKQKRSILTSLPDSTIYSEERFGPGGAFGSKRTMKTYTDGGGAGPYGGMQTPNLPALYAGAACPIGYRLNKSTYITRGGGTSRWGAAGSLIVHPKGSTCVKRRRRNVGNARALRRAISRVKGFVKLARKAHSLVGGHRRPKAIGKGGVEVIRTG